MEKLNSFFYANECCLDQDDDRDQCLAMKKILNDLIILNLNRRKPTIENLKAILVQGNWKYRPHNGKKDTAFWTIFVWGHMEPLFYRKVQNRR